MAKTRLTRRGKIVVGLIVVALIWWLNDMTTPAECKVDFDDLPQWCIGILYP